ncbi:MAG: pectinesterase family protein [Bacteroidota bacterium]|nr:pectinesterase family protein [Bacteroidota bacterium]
MNMIKYCLMLSVLMILNVSGLMAQDKMKITVAQDGSGDFTSIQAAIESCKAFPDERITVYVKNGTYHEKIKIPSCNPNLSIIGESVEKTIISYDDYFNKINLGRNSTFYTYTVLVEADDFYAENLTIENTAGPVGQAVALNVEGNRCVFKHCRILGNQDTLYTAGQNSRQYFTDCYIEGTTDFIFGAATVLFEGCTLCSKANSYVTAASTIKGKQFGYVFRNCKLIAKDGITRVYLGRPWRDYANVVFMNCDLGAHILPEGWANWDKTTRDQTAYYAEFGNKGAGANTDKRVAWSHQLTANEAKKYTLENILAPVLSNEPSPTDWTRRK